MLVLARESRGWTQKTLAERVSFNQSKISRFELGTLQPTADEVQAIADELNYDIGLFGQGDPIHAIGASLLYRQKARVPIKVQRRVEAEINIRKMQVGRLLRAAALDDHIFPSIPTDTLDGNVEAIAREVRRMWKVPDGPIADCTKLVEAAGGIVIHMNFDSRLIDGAHLWVPGLPPMFFMSRDVPGERYRFSLTHEIGHAVMHRASGIGEIEQEAHTFASEFLMPKAQIRSDLRNFDLEVARRLKAHWKVSMQALIERAFGLGVISDAKRRRLYTQISAQGSRINEPWPLPMEESSLFDRLVQFHRKDLGLESADLRQIMFTDRLGPIDPQSPRRHKLRLVGELSLFDGSTTEIMKPADESNTDAAEA